MTDTTEKEQAPGPDEPGDAAEPGGRAAVAGWLGLVFLIAALVALLLWAGATTFAVVAAFVLFIFLHELGHYLTARWAGMKVTQFFLFFGPTVWSFRRGETEYGVKCIPAGAFVRIIGMSNLEEVDPVDEHRTYRQQPYWRRMSVALAGSTMHFLIALVLVFSVFAFVGLPDYESADWRISEVMALEDGDVSPAQQAGLQPGDRVLSVDGQRFETFSDLARYVGERPGEEVTMVVERDGERLTITPELASRPGPEGTSSGFLGIAPRYPNETLGLPSAAVESVEATGRTMWLSVKGLGQFFSPDGISGYVDTLAGSANEGAESERLVSAVGAVQIASDAAGQGIGPALEILFFINVFIGVFNLFPLLPLDGGHVAIATYERIRSRKGRRYHADVSKLLPVTYAFVAVLLIVGVTALWLDITDPVLGGILT